MIHIPVLQKEIIEYLNPKSNENFIDCTIDGGGHALAILEKTAPKGKLLGIDWDEELIKKIKSEIKNPRLILVCDNFSNLLEIVKKIKFKNVAGILFDLGMSSWQLEKSGRGFSFLRKEPLDMRYNLKNPLSAEKIINYWSEKDIGKILNEYGQEQFANEIAKEIIKSRKLKEIKSTFQLVNIIKNATPSWYHKRKINPATKTFQALRIVVNDELKNLQMALSQSLAILKKGGKIAVISFHSLEDKIVKNFLKENFQKGYLKILTKKPIQASKNEVLLNPRSRSAKLRVGVKL